MGSLTQEIIRLYNEDITVAYSINQISKKLRKKYPYINKKVNYLLNRGILNKLVIGRSHLCSINLGNEEAILFLTINELQKKERFLERNSAASRLLQTLMQKKNQAGLKLIISSNEKFIMVVDDIPEAEKILKKPNLPKVVLLNKEDFQKKLLETKEILESHIILYSYERYFEYLCEIKDQLKLRYSKLLA